MKQPIFTWNEDERVATCIIFDSDNLPHEGIAKCHEDDLDMMNEKTGYAIAQQRAIIEGYKAFKQKTAIELKALKQLYYSMKHSKKFNTKSYEAKMLYRQINSKEEDILMTNELIKECKKNLSLYINQKDIFYKAVRKQRNSKK